MMNVSTGLMGKPFLPQRLLGPIRYSLVACEAFTGEPDKKRARERALFSSFERCFQSAFRLMPTVIAPIGAPVSSATVIETWLCSICVDSSFSASSTKIAAASPVP